MAQLFVKTDVKIVADFEIEHDYAKRNLQK